MRTAALALVALMAWGRDARALAPLHDPVALNIGVNCQWQRHCEASQRKAMRDARGYIAKSRPPAWRIHLCNRNAARGTARIDWVGFSNCIRNTTLRPPKARRRR